MRDHNLQAKEGCVEWDCPSNIAIVKYWGKRPLQLPANPSLSMGLDRTITRTRISYRFDMRQKAPSFSFHFEGQAEETFAKRIRAYLEVLQPLLPFLKYTSLEITSSNTFPHSSGIASSASAMGAMALCLCSVEQEITGSDAEVDLRRASMMARLGSGSASRSVFPGFALWGKTPAWKGSSDEYAIPLHTHHPAFDDTQDSILVVDAGKKAISSSAGHRLMEGHPYAGARLQQAGRNMKKLQTVLASGDWEQFIDVLEEEALSLHALMMSSSPGYILMKAGTLAIIERVRAFRRESKTALGFTLDAGANVHLLYPAGEALIPAFIESDLLPFCENGQLIHDSLGSGPKKLPA